MSKVGLKSTFEKVCLSNTAPETSSAAASDIYAPVSGTIEEINEELGDQPALLNRSPEENGEYAPMPRNCAR